MDATKDQGYFGYYSMLMHQQNMLQDNIRTSAYYNAVQMNVGDFMGKVVLDVGAGSGILSFFAAKCGAKKVYAVEASEMAKYTRRLVEANNLSHIITVLQSKIEDVELPELVDVIISEPIGVFLLHERMVESFIFARDKFLKKYTDSFLKNQLYPSMGTFKLSPFSDSNLYADTFNRAQFWSCPDFFGLNLSSLQSDAICHYFSQPVIGSFDPKCLLSREFSYSLDFASISLEQLRDFTIDFAFVIEFTGIIHGIASWFDLDFHGTNSLVTLSTSPSSPLTHWHQIRFLFKNPIAVNCGQIIKGSISMKVNNHRSYDVIVETLLNDHLSSNQYHLQEQQYSYLNTNITESNHENFNLYAPL